MTEQQHLITPSPELIEKWGNDSVPMMADATSQDWEIAFATRAARWGYEQCYEEIMLHAMHSIVPQPYVEDDGDD